MSTKYFSFAALQDIEYIIIVFSASTSDAVFVLWMCCQFD